MKQNSFGLIIFSIVLVLLGFINVYYFGNLFFGGVFLLFGILFLAGFIFKVLNKK